MLVERVFSGKYQIFEKFSIYVHHIFSVQSSNFHLKLFVTNVLGRVALIICENVHQCHRSSSRGHQMQILMIMPYG